MASAANKPGFLRAAIPNIGSKSSASDSPTYTMETAGGMGAKRNIIRKDSNRSNGGQEQWIVD
jgi:hypothetical protein